MNVTLGGVSPDTVANASIGILLRLGFSCYLGLPLASVKISRVVSSAPGAPAVLEGAALAPLNSANGSCAGVVTGNASNVTHSCARGNGSMDTTTLFLVLTYCFGGANNSVTARALNLTIAAGAESSNATVDHGNCAPLFSAFLSSVALILGVPQRALLAFISSPQASHGSLQVGAAFGAVTAPPEAMPPNITALAAAVSVAGALLVLIGVALVVLMRQRKMRREGPGSLPGDRQLLSGQARKRPFDSANVPSVANPMQAGRLGVKLAPERAGGAASPRPPPRHADVPDSISGVNPLLRGALRMASPGKTTSARHKPADSARKRTTAQGTLQHKSAAESFSSPNPLHAPASPLEPRKLGAEVSRTSVCRDELSPVHPGRLTVEWQRLYRVLLLAFCRTSLWRSLMGRFSLGTSS